MADVVLITGLSGAGRSGAADVLEDLGFYVVDNLPTSLIPTIVDLAGQTGSAISRLALVSGRQHDSVLDAVEQLKSAGHHVTILFLDASTAVLVQRYDATRRKHPFAGEATGVLEAIENERELLTALKAEADLVIDTSDLNVHQLKQRLVEAFDDVNRRELSVSVESFGFKHGLPLDSDIVMDVRFLPNPHWNEDLRPLTGLDSAVSDFVLDQPDAASFIDSFEAMLVGILPGYRAEGRVYLTIAIGCTGGRHRSVAIAEELAKRLTDRGVATNTSHRDISR